MVGGAGRARASTTCVGRSGPGAALPVGAEVAAAASRGRTEKRAPTGSSAQIHAPDMRMTLRSRRRRTSDDERRGPGDVAAAIIARSTMTAMADDSGGEPPGASGCFVAQRLRERLHDVERRLVPCARPPRASSACRAGGILGRRRPLRRASSRAWRRAAGRRGHDTRPRAARAEGMRSNRQGEPTRGEIS